MLRSFTHSEMLRLWRTVAGLEPLRADCRIERIEGLDADAIIAPRMRAWYLHLLDTAPTSLLPVEDVAGEFVLTPGLTGATASGRLPSRVRRLLSVRLTGWLNPALPRSVGTAARSAWLSLNPYLAPGLCHPLCIIGDRTIEICPFEDGDVLLSATAVVDPGPDTYTLDEYLLSTIPDILTDYDNI